ncbi:MFS transporter [Mycolicibacterium boenickei]|uniref:MFS transporter n=1 Tax=Mycolicibacterium boenickei TaxID=146017 RepID=UPI003B2816A8
MASFAQWIEGARPRTLPNAVAPVLAGTGAAAWVGSAVWWKALLALAVSLALITGVNYANDYSDGIRGTDDVRSGPLRLVGSKLASPRAVLTAAVVSELLTRYWKPLLLCFLITMGGTLAFYAYSVNAPAIVKTTYKDQAMTATWINLIGLIFLMAIQPIGGMISDKVGRKPLLVFFGIGGVLYTYVLFTYLPQTHSPIVSFLLVAVAYVILTGYTSINALVKSELFPSHIRALGVGIGYALANSMFGGTAPVIYQALKDRDLVPWFIAYVTVCIALSLWVYLAFLKNKAETYLDREKGAAFIR